ncbi:MAG: hypothetical protein ACI9AR_000383 [Flavobacteriaceae bacterium]|jgi:hypothetical protein
MKIVEKILTKRAEKRLAKIYQAHHDASFKQEQILVEILHTNEDSFYGRKYDFTHNNTIEKFQKNVPVVSHEDIYTLIDRMHNGEEDLLATGKIPFFAKSSGTSTGRSKLLPVSDDTLVDNHYKAGADMYLTQIANNPKTRWWKGRTVFIGGSVDHNTSADTLSGDISGILLTQSPFWTQFFKAPEPEILLEKDWSKKLDNIVHKIIKKNITSFAGVPTWTLRILQRAEEITGKTIKEIWPSFELYIHGGVSFEPYRTVFKKLLPEQTTYINAYNSSEGYFAYQDTKNSDELLLCIEHGIFYEFMKLDDLKKEKPHTYTIDTIEIGVPYALIITHRAGLYRYNMGDIIEFTSKDPYRIRILGRTQQHINIFGEEVMQHNIEAVLSDIERDFSLHTSDYTIGARLSLEEGTGAHEWIIEFQEEIDTSQRIILEEYIDTSLRSKNSDYDSKRQGGALLQAPLHIVPKETFHNWLTSKGKTGQSYKVPRLKSDSGIIDEVLSSLK